MFFFCVENYVREKSPILLRLRENHSQKNNKKKDEEK